MFNKYLAGKLSFSLLFFLISPFAVGQSETAGDGIGEGYLNFIILLFVALIVLVFVLLFIFGMDNEQVEEEEAE